MSRPHNPCNFIIQPTAANQPLIQKLTQYQKRNREINLTFTAEPAPEHETGIYVIHESRAFELLNPTERLKTWLPVICFGRGEHLKQSALLGCSDYLKEPWSPFELHFRISRLTPKSNYEFSWGIIYLTSMKVSFNDREIPLSAQEYRILRTLMQNRGRVVPRDVLYYSLWGKTGKGSRVVDMHISRIRNKLCMILKAEISNKLIRTVHHIGYTIR